MRTKEARLPTEPKQEILANMYLSRSMSIVGKIQGPKHREYYVGRCPSDPGLLLFYPKGLPRRGPNKTEAVVRIGMAPNINPGLLDQWFKGRVPDGLRTGLWCHRVATWRKANAMLFIGPRQLEVSGRPHPYESMQVSLEPAVEVLIAGHVVARRIVGVGESVSPAELRRRELFGKVTSKLMDEYEHRSHEPHQQRPWWTE